MNSTRIELTPAVIYARFSSSGQREESITGQIRDCMAFAERSGYKIIKTYEDRAKTGTNDQRPAFQQMIKDSTKHQFQAVIVWKLDRFARDKYDSARYKHQLSQNGVRVISAMEPISSSPEGVIMESLLEGMAQYYSMDLSLKVKRGNRESAMEHKTVGMRMLGYKPDDSDHFVIDQETAPIVNRIFTEYASGKMIKDIVSDLNADGLRTRKGKEWSKTSLQHILRNERYTGTYIFGDYREENAMPAIISRDLWNECQDKIQKHRIAPAASRSVKYLLTGKVFCGMCGSPMIGVSGTGKAGKRYFYYQDTKREDKSCRMKRIQKERLENAVVSFLVNQVSDDAFVNEIADRCMDYINHKKSVNAEALTLKSQYDDVVKRLKNLEDAVEHGIYNDTTQQRMLDLQKRRDDLSDALIKAEMQEPGHITRDQIVSVLQSMRGDPSDEQYQIRMIDMFLNAAYVYPDDQKMVITINFQNEKGEPISYETACELYDECSSLAQSGSPFIVWNAA